MDPEACTVAPRGRPIRNPYRFATHCVPTRTFDTCDNTVERPLTPDQPAQSRHQPSGWEYQWEDGEHPDDPRDMQEHYQQCKEAERAEKARKLAAERLLTHCHFPSYLLPFFPESQP